MNIYIQYVVYQFFIVFEVQLQRRSTESKKFTSFPKFHFSFVISYLIFYDICRVVGQLELHERNLDFEACCRQPKSLLLISKYPLPQ